LMRRAGLVPIPEQWRFQFDMGLRLAQGRGDLLEENISNSRRTVLIPDYKSHFEEPDRGHSYLSATIGSTFVARRAGIQQASSDTAASSKTIPINVSGSLGLTPKSKLRIACPKASAAANPIANPDSASLLP